MDERVLAERLITYDTSTGEGIQSAAGFVKGWLEARDIDVLGEYVHGRPVLAATVGAPAGEVAPTVVLHGHLDVVPGHVQQFEPRVEGDRLIGRGAYDMKSGLAAMMCATRELTAQADVRVHFVCVSDEESDDDTEKGSDWLVKRGYGGDFAITGEPTDLKIGVQAKGVLAMRVTVSGKAAHGSTPWLGDNAVIKAVDVFRQIESLPFGRDSSDLFDRPSVNLARVVGGDALNKVPDTCAIDIDVRYLPGQEPGAIMASVRELPDVEVTALYQREPAIVGADSPLVLALARAVDRDPEEDTAAAAQRVSVGRDGASDAISFLRAGVPAVEFGPSGGGHHGPDEWVSVASLAAYRQALVDFVRLVPETLSERRLRVA